MAYLYIIPSYLHWHYGEAFNDITRVWTNFLWFLTNYFSVNLLLRSLFAPWRRIHEESIMEKLTFEAVAGKIVENTAMRLVGFVMRIIIIVIGGVIILASFWIGTIFYAIWVLMPVIIPTAFLFGLSSIFGVV